MSRPISSLRGESSFFTWLRRFAIDVVRGPSSHRWMTFVRNHAQVMLVCDYLVAVTARFQVLYVFVIRELGRTARTISERQQFRHSSRQSGKLRQFVLM
jgi:hypothetical protein